MKNKFILAVLSIMFLSNAAFADAIFDLQTGNQKLAAYTGTGNVQKETRISHSGVSGYLKENNQLLDSILDGLPEKLSKLDATAFFTSEYDGVASNFDIFTGTKGGVQWSWYDGNYIASDSAVVMESLANNEDFIAGVYNKDRLLQGYVFCINYKNKLAIIEYKFDGSFYLSLKTILLYHIDASEPAFLYDANKKLLVYTLNGNLKIETDNVIKKPEFLNDFVKNFNN